MIFPNRQPRLSGWRRACTSAKENDFPSEWPHACPQQIATVPAQVAGHMSSTNCHRSSAKKIDFPSEWLATCLSSTNCHRSSAKKIDFPSEWLASAKKTVFLSEWLATCPQQIATVPALKKWFSVWVAGHMPVLNKLPPLQRKKKWFPRPSLSTRQGFTSWCFGCGYWHLFNHGKFRGNLSLGTKTLHKNLSKGSTPGVYHASRRGSGNYDCPYLPSQSKSCNSGKKRKDSRF